MAPVPLKITLLVLKVKAPLLVQLPATVRVFDPVIVNAVPLCIVIFRHTAPARVIEGLFRISALKEGIKTSVVAVGTPPHQLPASFQAELFAPVQVPGIHDEPTARRPVVDGSKYALGLVAVDPVDP